MTAALVMVFVNKAVLNNSPDLPLLFLLNQLVIAVILLHISALISKRVELPKFSIENAAKLVPVVLVNVIARGLVLPLTILVSSVHTKSAPPLTTLIAAASVTFGFFIGVAPSQSLPAAATPSFLSLIYGVLSSLFIALHAVLIKSSLPHCNNSTIQLAWWTNFGSAVFLLPAVLLHGEFALFHGMINDPAWNGTVFLWGSAITGFFGFLLCIAGLLSIKVTSPITHMFSSAARSVLQTLLGVWIFNDVLTVPRGTSIMVILAGTMYYTWIKSQPPPSQGRRPEDIERAPGSVALGTPGETKDLREKI
ncbi:hypothetical protein H0H93_004943 [Arthromyces matolae]|nr:hypothetical protein H0H93_004943 [Arthromyces matolae]